MNKILKISFLLTQVLMAGCASVPPPVVVDDIEHQRIVPGGSAKLILKSTGMPMDVEYSVNSSSEFCKNFEKAGTVRDVGEDVVLPWIAKLSKKLNRTPAEVERLVPAAREVQISGFGKWFNEAGRSNTCGPVVTKFTPKEGSIYLVEFVWQGLVFCSGRVVDVTDPLDKKAVPVEYSVCPRSFMDVFFNRSGT